MKLKILFVSTEVHPFAKTGGLADVSGALPPALKKLGHDIRVIMPKYPCTSKAGKGMQPLKVDLDIPGFNQKGTLFQSELTDSVPVYLIEHDDYYNREHIYGEPGSDYPDSLERFAFFLPGRPGLGASTPNITMSFPPSHSVDSLTRPGKSVRNAGVPNVRS